MKKFFVVIVMFLVLICSKNVENDFTLLDYFSGEYTSYTEEIESEESLNLGFCYMQDKDVDKNKLVGESLKIYNFEPINALKKLNATLVKTECLDNGLVVIYAYTNKIKDYVEVDNKKVNIQIANNDECSVVGWPLILGSF